MRLTAVCYSSDRTHSYGFYDVAETDGVVLWWWCSRESNLIVILSLLHKISNDTLLKLLINWAGLVMNLFTILDL